MKTMRYFTASGEKVNAYYVDKLDAAKLIGNPSLTVKVNGQYVIGYRAGTNGFKAEDCVPVSRAISFKVDGSNHKCDARCLNATGHNCECSCGGKNHGANN